MMAISVAGYAQSETFFDDFESGSLTTKGWTQEPATGVTPWRVGNSGVGTVTPYEGTKMAWLFSPLYQPPVKMYTPFINIGGSAEPHLSFYMASEKFNFSPRDTLKVYYREQGQTHWVLMRGYNQNTDNWEKKEIRLKAYTQAENIQIAFEHCYGNGKGIALDSIKIYSASVCNTPQGLNVQNVEATSATLRWAVNNYTRTSKLKVSTVPININTLDNVTTDIMDTTVAIPYCVLSNYAVGQKQPLQANTTYYWYVKADCGPSDVSKWAFGSFKTRCNPISSADIPNITEGFETVPANGYPSCWLRKRELTGDWVNEVVPDNTFLPTVVSGISKAGSKSLKIESYYESNQAITIPRVVRSFAIAQACDFDYTDNYQVSFHMMTDLDRGSTLHVGIMTNPDDLSTFQEIEAMPITASNTWIPKTVYFLNNTNNGKYVAFMTSGADGNAINTVYIDEVRISRIPDCPKPTDFAMQGDLRPSTVPGKFDVTFSWFSLYPTHQYKIAITTTNESPVRTRPMYESDPVLPSTHAVVGQLNGLSRYFAWIKNNCGNEWVGPVGFVTPMVSMPLPSDETFEGVKTWTESNGTQPTKWYVGDKAKRSGNRGLYVSKDNGVTAPTYNKDYKSTVYAYKKFKFNQGKYIEIPFYWKNNGSKDAYMQAYLVPSTQENTIVAGQEPTAEWVPITGKLYGNPDWAKYVGRFLSPVALDYLLVIGWFNEVEAVENTPGGAIDDLKITEVTCSSPMNVKVDSITDQQARVTWRKGDVGNPQSWSVYYAPRGTDPLTQTPVVVPGTQTSLLLTGLTPLTDYHVYVKATCGAVSSFEFGVPFQTHQVAATVPFTENFEGATTTVRINNGTQKNMWVVGTADKQAGQKSLYISNTAAGTARAYTIADATSYVYAYQTFVFDKSEVYNCSFNWKSGGEANRDLMNVFLVPDEVHDELAGGEANGMEDASNDPPVTWTKFGPNGGPFFNTASRTTWQSYSNSFAVPRTGRYKIVWFWKNDGSGGAMTGAAGIDNISVEKIDCPAPFTIKATPQGDGTTLLVTWEQSQTATSWDVYWGTNQANLAGPFNVTSPSFTATGVSTVPETVYYFKIQTRCGSSGTPGDVKTHPYTVTTMLPYYTSFEEDTDNSKWTLKRYTGSNSWVIHTAADAVKDGLKALYISDSYNSTKNYRYMLSSTSKASAYRVFSLEQGAKYRIMFDWKAQGEGNYDYLRAALAPAESAASLKTSQGPLIQASNLPAGWIDIGGGRLNENSAMRHVQYDFLAPSTGVYYVVFYWINDASGGTQPPAAIDKFYFLPNECPMPVDVEVNNITQNSATVQWSSTDAESYDIKISASPIDPETQQGDIYNDINTLDTLHRISGLTPGETYYVYVRANCSSTSHSYYNIEQIVFSTLCASRPVPYTTDFESDMLNQLPLCWSQVYQDGGVEGAYNAYVKVGAGDNKVLTLDSYVIYEGTDSAASTQLYAVLPYFTNPINTLQVSFTVIGDDSKSVWITPMRQSGSGVAPLNNIRKFTASPDGNRYTQVLSGVATNSIAISFLAQGDDNGRGTVAIDNIVVDVADMCMPPNSVGHENVTDNSVRIKWDSPYYGSQTWNVAVTTVDMSGNLAGIDALPAPQKPYHQNVTVLDNATFVNVSGLTSNTKYYYYVRKLCDDNVTYGDWYTGDETMSFTTLCMTQDLCDLIIVKYADGTANGWGPNTKLHITREGTPIDTLTFVPSAMTPSENTPLKLCANIYNLTFDKQSNTSSVHFAIIDVDGDTVFRSTPNDRLSENFTFELLPNSCEIFACEEVRNVTYTNVTTTEFTVNWTGTGSSYNVKVYEGAVVDDTSTPIRNQNVTTNSITINNLTHNTLYTVVIVSNCTSGSTTIQSNSSMSTIRTLIERPVDPMPLNITFEDAAEPAKWQMYGLEESLNRWTIGSAVSKAGSNSLYISKDNGVSHDYQYNSLTYAYATRYVQLTANTDYHLRFDYMVRGELNRDIGRVFIIPAGYSRISEGYHYGMDGNNNTPPADWIDPCGILYNANTWTEVDTIFSIPTTGKYFVAIFWKNNTSGSYQPPLAIDNLELYEEVCSQPSQLAVSNITANSADVSWEGLAPSYDVKVTLYSQLLDPTSLPQVAGQAGNTTKTFAITGLNSNTVYTIYVKSKCGAGQESKWRRIDFKTDFSIDQMPLLTTFEDAVDNAKWITSSSNGPSAGNRWEIGSATGNGPSSMYISQNGGTANSYGVLIESYAYAFRAYQLNAADEYKLQFDWKCGGEADKDLGRVFLIPAAYKEQVVAGANFGMTGTMNNAPVDWIDVGGVDTENPNMLRGKTTWQTTQVMNIGVPTNGVYYLAFFWKNDSRSGSQPPLAVDNVFFELVPCPAPKNVSVATRNTSATVTWTGTASSYELELYDIANLTVPIQQQVVNSPTTTHTFPGLTPAATYLMKIRSSCSGGLYSDYREKTFRAINETDTLPINATFEEQVDNYMWRFSSSAGQNKWRIGRGAKKDGSWGLYVSNSTGGNGVDEVTGTISNNVYSTNSASSAYAYRKVQLKRATDYACSFNWRADGERSSSGTSTWDYLRVFIAPASADLSNGNTNGMSTNGSFVPNGWIDLNPNKGALCKQPEWQRIDTVGIKVNITDDYYLVFYWRNDGSSGTQPPAAIDNFRFSEVRQVHITDSVCVGHEYTRNNFNLPQDSTMQLGVNTFSQIYTDPQTGETMSMVLHLNVMPGNEHRIHRTVCQGDTVHFFGRPIRATTSKEYKYYTMARNGCDSVEILVLTVNESPNILIDTVLDNCLDLPATINGQYYDLEYPTGTWLAISHHTTAAGCDSTITYAVTIDGPCNSLSVAEMKNVSFIPNPIDRNDKLTITGDFTAEELRGLRVEVLTSRGEIVSSIYPESMPITLSPFRVSGIYIVRIQTGTGEVIYGKVIVK